MMFFVSVRGNVKGGLREIHFCKEDELTGAVLNEKNHNKAS